MEDSRKVEKFDEEKLGRGFSIIRLEQLHDLESGYLVEETCTIEADVTIFGDVTIKSNGSSEDTGNAIVAKNSTEKDIDAFFLNLESEISSSKNLSLREEAEEALTVIKNALNRDPAESNYTGRISQITDAFDVLSSLGDYSVLTGTAEQKEELLTMKEKFFDLPKRAAKAAEDKNQFMQKELVKRIIERKLGRCLIEFKKAKEGTEQQEQNIATLQEQVDLFLAQIDEAQKKKANFSSKQEEMFEISKSLKAKLDGLEKKWPKYEAKMKAAKEEEKMVCAEWHKMKQFVSSLKGPYSSSLKEYFM